IPVEVVEDCQPRPPTWQPPWYWHPADFWRSTARDAQFPQNVYAPPCGPASCHRNRGGVYCVQGNCEKEAAMRMHWTLGVVAVFCAAVLGADGPQPRPVEGGAARGAGGAGVALVVKDADPKAQAAVAVESVEIAATIHGPLAQTRMTLVFR